MWQNKRQRMERFIVGESRAAVLASDRYCPPLNVARPNPMTSHGLAWAMNYEKNKSDGVGGLLTREKQKDTLECIQLVRAHPRFFAQAWKWKWKWNAAEIKKKWWWWWRVISLMAQRKCCFASPFDLGIMCLVYCSGLHCSLNIVQCNQ